MSYSRALALLLALGFAFSSEGFGLRRTGEHDVAPDSHQPSRAQEEAVGQGENMEDPDPSFEEEGGEEDEEQVENDVKQEEPPTSALQTMSDYKGGVCNEKHGDGIPSVRKKKDSAQKKKDWYCYWWNALTNGWGPALTSQCEWGRGHDQNTEDKWKDKWTVKPHVDGMYYYYWRRCEGRKCEPVVSNVTGQQCDGCDGSFPNTKCGPESFECACCLHSTNLCYGECVCKHR